MIARHSTFASNRGAALIVGLILLIVLSLMAIAGMNSAKLEFIMAGNEQYRQTAFQAAETGIAQVVANIQPVASGDPALSTVSASGQTLTGLPGVTYDYTLSYAGKTKTAASPKPTSIGSNAGTTVFASYHWQVVSSGNAPRKSQVTNTQGFAEDRPDDSSVATSPGCNPPTAAACQLN